MRITEKFVKLLLQDSLNNNSFNYNRFIILVEKFMNERVFSQVSKRLN